MGALCAPWLLLWTGQDLVGASNEHTAAKDAQMSKPTSRNIWMFMKHSLDLK